MKVFTLLGLILSLISGCQDIKDDSNIIIYNNLPEMKVQLLKEISESKDYITGRLGDLILTSDGTLLVSDLGKITIEQFNAKGEHLSTIAEEGNGPGELPSIFFLHEGSNDTLIVWHGNMLHRIDYYSKGSNGVYTFNKSLTRESSNNRVVSIAGVRSNKRYYAKTRLRSKALLRQLEKHPDYYWSTMVITDEVNNIIQDSLHKLKTPSPIVERSAAGGMMYYGVPPYQYQDHFRLMEDGFYLIARADSSIFSIYNNNHRIDRQIPLKIKGQTVKKSDLEDIFKLMDVDSETRRKMEARVPDTKPPFMNVWLSSNNIWLHTNTSKKGKQIVALSEKGEPVGKFYLSEYDDIRYFRDGRIYTLHQNPKAGHSLRIYEINE